MDKKLSFEAKGIVLGNYWGGGQGGYSSRTITSDSKEEIITKANEMLKDGSLDSGMGYESLIGAILIITTTTTIKNKGQEFSRKDSETVFIGELTEEQENQLMAWEETYYL